MLTYKTKMLHVNDTVITQLVRLIQHYMLTMMLTDLNAQE